MYSWYPLMGGYLSTCPHHSVGDLTTTQSFEINTHIQYVCWCVDVLMCWCVDVLMCWCVDDIVLVLKIAMKIVPIDSSDQVFLEKNCYFHKHWKKGFFFPICKTIFFLYWKAIFIPMLERRNFLFPKKVLVSIASFYFQAKNRFFFSLSMRE